MLGILKGSPKKELQWRLEVVFESVKPVLPAREEALP